MIFNSRRKKTAVFALLIVLLVVCVSALRAGSYDLTLREIFSILRIKIFGGDAETLSKLNTVIVWNVRMPRILLAVLSGISFSLSGTVYQACFRNPLVEPYVLGVSAGAAFGASLGIVFPEVFRSVQLAAFLSALFAVALTYSVAKSRSQTPVITLVISGMVIGSLFTALVSLLKYAAPDAKLREITFWMLGGFYYATWKDAAVTAPIVLIAFVIASAFAWKLNILSMGDEEARSLGVHPERYRLFFIALTTLIIALCVSQAGIIAWVGLMAPHAARMIFGADNAYVIPAGSLLGAIFLLVCDTLARTLTGSEIPIGILVSIVGAPFLIFLLKSRGRELYG